MCIVQVFVLFIFVIQVEHVVMKALSLGLVKGTLTTR